MASHYIENGNSGNQYYFDANAGSVSPGQRSGQDRVYASPGATVTSVGSTEFSPYPAGVSAARSQQQQQYVQSDRKTYNEDNSYQVPQQHQSVAGFSKTTSQQPYQSSASPAPQVRATVRSVTSQEQQQQRPQQSFANYDQQTSPQQQQYQYDSRQQSGQNTANSGYYQPPSVAQYPQQEVDQRTESPTRNRDQYGQVLV